MERIEKSSLDSLDSPCLLVIQERVQENIQLAISMMKDPSQLRPHIKTHKNPWIIDLCIQKGIEKFKCATIAEAELLALQGAKDILLAYPLNSPKIGRLTSLIDQYPKSIFSCLVDNKELINLLNEEGIKKNHPISVWLDINTGMDRTGMKVQEIPAFYDFISSLKGIQFQGFHNYPGHIVQSNLDLRRVEFVQANQEMESIFKEFINQGINCRYIVGGTPCFPFYSQNPLLESSPGTFIYWDFGYQNYYPEQKFKVAAYLLSRVVSKPNSDLICLDLGYKSVSSEKPLSERVYFPSMPDAKFISQSEEHLVLKTNIHPMIQVGDSYLGIPYHICPTVALYESIEKIENGKWIGSSLNLARNRKIYH